MKEDLLYDYWWASQENNYCKPLAAIASRAGGARALYEMGEYDLSNIKGVTSEYAKIICNRRENWDLEGEYEKCIINNISFIPYYCDEYPDKLKNISSPPYALFVKGKLPDMNKRSVAIIGARDCSEYGRIVAKEFGEGLAKYDVQIISGMAYGIDGIAQMSALDAGGSSFGILGCGPDICYPRTNRILYERLLNHGGIISEYGIGTQAKSRLFPPRNRIISALSDLIVVIEARRKSGTSITVDMALDQGKDIAVVPGRITDSLSEGCNRLWKMGASPVTSVQDIMCLLDASFEEDINEYGPDKKPIVILQKDEKIVFDALDMYPLSITNLEEKTGFDAVRIMHSLLSLMIQDYAREDMKGYYIKTKDIEVIAK